MKKLLIIILLLTSCGSNGKVTSEHYVVSYDALQEICSTPPCRGEAFWYENPNGYIDCDIYMLPYEDYARPDLKKPHLTQEEQYLVTLGHEMRHCEEGDWHP